MQRMWRLDSTPEAALASVQRIAQARIDEAAAQRRRREHA
jgi:hypothetical protein